MFYKRSDHDRPNYLEWNLAEANTLGDQLALAVWILVRVGPIKDILRSYNGISPILFKEDSKFLMGNQDILLTRKIMYSGSQN